MKKKCFILRVIKPEEGKKLADSWGAAFMESSAKENEVKTKIFCYFYFAWNVNTEPWHMVFSQHRLLWRFSRESFWRWRRLMEMHLQKRRSVQWCKSQPRNIISKLFYWRQAAQLHQLTICDLTDAKMLQWNFSSPLWYQIDLKRRSSCPDSWYHMQLLVTTGKCF